MIDSKGALRCNACGKEILLRVTLQEGNIEFYCPRCHHYQKIIASTAQYLTNLVKSGIHKNIA